MTDSPRIITRTSRSSGGTKRTFRFSSADMRTLMHTGLAAYRQAAMAAYESLPLPTTQEEAWRRTDIRHLEPEVFRFPAAGEFRSLASVPDALKAPLADGDHGGELLLVPGGSQVHLASELAAKGVIFTTLQAAEREHPELLARIIGTIVKPDEGKFAAMAGAFAQDGVLLFIPSGVQVEQPLHSLLWGPGINWRTQLISLSGWKMGLPSPMSMNQHHPPKKMVKVCMPGWLRFMWAKGKIALCGTSIMGRACL